MATHFFVCNRILVFELVIIILEFVIFALSLLWSYLLWLVGILETAYPNIYDGSAILNFYV